MKQHYIYQTTNLINAKQYIGYHYGESNDDYLGSGTMFKKALKKYGAENFHKDILYVGDDAINFEEKFIETVRPKYNIAQGGEGGGYWMKYASEEQQEARKRKIGDKNRGKKRTEEQVERNRVAQAGKKRTDETKKRISLGLQGRTRSDETKRKISESHKGKKQDPEHTRKRMEASKRTKEKKNNNRMFYYLYLGTNE